MPELAEHLFVYCRYTMRLWGLVREWIGLTSMDIEGWATTTIHDWWAIMTSRKDLASLTLITSWEI
jgi:hypothetical protein